MPSLALPLGTCAAVQLPSASKLVHGGSTKIYMFNELSLFQMLQDICPRMRKFAMVSG
jgi:hypothetical protein